MKAIKFASEECTMPLEPRVEDTIRSLKQRTPSSSPPPHTHTEAHRSDGSKGARGTRAPPPSGPNNLIFMQFSEKIGQIIDWRSQLWGSRPLLWEILDPPLHHTHTHTHKRTQIYYRKSYQALFPPLISDVVSSQ